jgi:CubicO group peptidase (beta-lactamase class C family)
VTLRYAVFASACGRKDASTNPSPATVVPSADFPRAPADAVDREALGRLVRAADAAHSDALLVLVDGKLVCEEYFGHPRGPIETMSVTKSFVSLAIGLLLAEGKISSVDEPLQRWFPEFAQGPKATMTLRHVLTHTSGLDHRPAAGVLMQQEDRLAYVRALPVVEPAGKTFSYNNEAVQLLSGVIESAAKKPVDAYLDEKLFTPLGIRDWTWAKDKRGNVATFWGLALPARDLAKVGLLLLRGGRHEGRDIVPSAWIKESTRPAREGAPNGYLWWVHDDGFRADGWLGQYLVVYPKLGLVGVRQHREPEGGADEQENEAHGFKEFPALARELAVR